MVSPPDITSSPTVVSPPSPSRTRTRSSTSRNKPRPQTGYLPRSAQSKPLPPSPKHAGTGLASNPFWSSILRQRPRSRRSIPALKGVSSSQIPTSPHSASAAPPPVPPKSPSHPAFHVRTPSTSSTTSTGSAYSTNTMSTTTASSSPLAPASSMKASTPTAGTSKPARTRLHSSSSSSSSGSTGTASSSTTATSSSPPHTPNSTPFPSRPLAHPFPISSSCPSPAKSILTRSSSVSTAGKHSLASGTGTHSASLLSCASKSVTFVDAPTVHYHDAGSWGIGRVEEEAYGDILDASIDRSSDGGDIRMPGVRRYEADLDSDMGLDVEGMDMDMDTENGSFSTHTNDSLQSKGLKRFISVSKKTPPRTRPSRPTISGPFALGSFPDTPGRSSSPARSTHSFRSASTCSPSLRSTPSVRSTHSAGHTYKPTHLKAHSYSHPPKPRMPYPASMHSLRAEPSCESLGRSVRSLGSVKSTTSTRGFRTWLAKIGAGLGLAGVGWEP
ncbi:hypothetical protein BDZ94DRAFT_1315964 [Collybia nuda]|uniref:Uncharacterized protein n=1 Tax=Collybia nuda TaxID=64659 RepID=A0A9P5XRK6_9AGAR|nr:hypothetical protein BDZ94DRAFT_1315964 [Collybia nuda]